MGLLLFYRIPMLPYIIKEDIPLRLREKEESDKEIAGRICSGFYEDPLVNNWIERIQEVKR